MCFGLNFFEIFKDTFFKNTSEQLLLKFAEYLFLWMHFCSFGQICFAEHNSRILQFICLKEPRFYFATICVKSLCWILSVVSLWCNCFHKSIPYIFFSHRLVYYDKKHFVQSWWIWQPFTLQVTILLHQKSLNYQNVKVRAEEVLRKHFPKI